MTRVALARLSTAFVASVCLSGLVASAQGESSKFSATLVPEQEVPAVSSVASGTITLDIDDTVGQEEITYELSYSDLQAEIRQAHIHFAQPGVNGGIVLWLCDSATNPSPFASTPACPQSGTVSGTLTSADVAGTPTNTQQINAGEIAEAIAFIRKGLGYANVHTSISTGGEIRGQIRLGSALR
jgi:hypothetical protein